MKHVTLFLTVLFSCTITAFSEEPVTGPSMMMDASEGTGTMMSAYEPMVEGGKVQFTDLEAALKRAAEGPTVLFFYADWCPTCRAAMKDIDDEIDKLGDITIIVVDYDSAKDLRKKYSITYQHTYVRIDADGKTLLIWNGGGVDSILSHIKREEVK
jgi:thiol-disulfide isomerase/thioredoxin